MWIRLLKAACEPPACLVILVLLGLILRRWRPRGAAWLVGLAGAALFVLSLPVVGGLLLCSLQTFPTADLLQVKVDPPGAIVVLAAGNSKHAPEYPYGGQTCGPFTLERIRYAAHLHRQTGLPVLVSGGRLADDQPPAAQLMAEVLRQEFQVTVQWVEGRSRTTGENAAHAAEMLESAGIGRVLLVTHAWHMRRAAAAFERVGLEVLAAPTAFRSPPRYSPTEWIPSWKGLRDSSLAWHEWLGALWYRLGGGG